MTRRIIKFAAAVAPAALLLAAGAPAQAKVLVMGDGGWEVSFDGSINAFLVFGEPDDPPAAPSGTRAGTAGTPAGLGLRDDLDSARVRTGLLPTVWGMNVKAPTTGGLDMAARIGLYPNISNNQKNTGVLNTADLDMREIFFTVDGAWGQLLAGKTLSQFMGKNILTDMTLFGVGGLGGVTKAGGTTLGRIGLGYVYPQFNARIQYTTPDMSGFKVSVGAYDPSNINSVSASAPTSATDPAGTPVNAVETNTPRMEGEASYAGNFGGADVSAWINGLWQEAEFASGCGLSSCTGDVTAWGFGGGLQVTVPVGPGSLQLVGSGYTGEALGTTFPLDGIGVEAILDSTGKERENDGFIGQAVYAFGQGTSLGYSYGESNSDETTTDTSERLTLGDVEVESQSLHAVMLWHDVNPNWRLIAEYGRQEAEWFDGADQEVDIFSIGTFFFW
jgi:hypothetical protein